MSILADGSCEPEGPAGGRKTDLLRSVLAKPFFDVHGRFAQIQYLSSRSGQSLNTPLLVELMESLGQHVA